MPELNIIVLVKAIAKPSLINSIRDGVVDFLIEQVKGLGTADLSGFQNLTGLDLELATLPQPRYTPRSNTPRTSRL